MVKGKMLHFVAFFVHCDKLIRPHPGPLWGGVYRCPNFLALFYQVKVPKIGTFLLKTHNISMFFGHFFIMIMKITIITIITIIAIIIIIIGTFFLAYA